MKVKLPSNLKFCQSKNSENALFVAILKNLYLNFPATVELELNGLKFFGKFVVLEKKFVDIV
jgi:hypothetical protein